jgi:outer membrane protein assembly factor BamB
MHRVWIAALLLLGLIDALPAHARGTTPAASPEAAHASGWTNFKGDAGRRGVADAGPTGQPVQLWRVQAAGPCNPPPATVAGVVYAPCSDGILYVLDAATGAERWRFTGAGPLGDVSVASDLVYVNDTDVLRALDVTTGEERWHAAAPAGTGVVVENGVLLIGTGDGFLLGLETATGAERWRFTVSTQGAAHNPAMSGGIAYVGGDDPGFFAVDAASGQLLWRGDTGTDENGTAVVADGTAYLGGSAESGEGHLYAFDAATGALLWCRDEPIFTPAVLDGVGYSGSVAGIVYAFDTATGQERWRVSLGGVVRPVAVAQGVVYAPSDGDRALYALDAATGQQLWSFAVDSGIDGSLAVDGGVAYVSTTFGSIYAIGGMGEGAVPGVAATSEATTPAATVPVPATPMASPAAQINPVELVWTTQGGAGGFDNPGHVALDSQGRLWVVDNGHGRFQIFDADGAFLETWGTPGTGDGRFAFRRSNGDGYGGIGFAPDGSFYVLDPGNHRIQKFDQNRRFMLSWGTFGTDPGQFIDPVGLVVDAAGTAYVVDDERDVVEWYGPDGAVLDSFDIHPDGRGGFNTINGIALDAAGNIYISDIPGYQVLKFRPDGSLVTVFGGPSGGNGQFTDQLVAMAIDAAGRLFVTETRGGGRVQIFDGNGQYLAGWGTDGQVSYGIVLDRTGNVYVGDYGANVVQKFHLLLPLAPANGTATP